MAEAGHGVAGSTVMTAMARNGTELGIRVSGLGDSWFTAPAAAPDGPARLTAERTPYSGSIGQSRGQGRACS